MLFASHAAMAQNHTVQFEAPMSISAQDFLGQENMQSAYHSVDPQAFTDGMAVIYKITSAEGEAQITGVNAARRYIQEIEAIEMLRAQSTLNMVGKSAFNRTTNLVRTPIRTLNTIGESAAKIESVEEAVLFIPKGVGEVGINLVKGAGEIGVTGVRLAKKASNTKCQGLGACLNSAVEDIWSGFNSFVGKKNSARRLHANLGTDPESRNKILQKQIDRLSYAESYTGSAYKLAVSSAGIDILSPYQTGIGWFNNGEFLAGYEDGHKSRNRDKAKLESWGLTLDEIDRLYRNTAFTNADRAKLVAITSQIAEPVDKVKLIREVIDFNSPYLIETRLQSYDYLALLSTRGEVQNFASNAPAPIIVSPDQTLIFPVAADYLQWTPQLAVPIDYLSQIRRGQTAEVHVIGHASDTFKQNAQRRGLKVIELN